MSASDIQVSFTGRVLLDPSRITTRANTGNGGNISVQGGKLVQLDNSHITTSVLGASGNGGDIAIRADALVMQTGSIQANTAGTGARGGNVTIDVQTLVPSGNTLLIGGTSPHGFQPGVFGFNVIQAAAPTGIGGIIEVNTPRLDIAGTLRGLSTELVTFGALGKDLCRVGASSSLTPLGRGGLRPTSAGLMRPEGLALAPGAGGVHANAMVRQRHGAPTPWCANASGVGAGG